MQKGHPIMVLDDAIMDSISMALFVEERCIFTANYIDKYEKACLKVACNHLRWVLACTRGQKWS